MESGVSNDTEGMVERTADKETLDELIGLVAQKPNVEGKSHAEQLMKKIDGLIQKHKADLSTCLADWLKSEWDVLVHAAPSNVNGNSRSSPAILQFEKPERSEDSFEAQAMPIPPHVVIHSATADMATFKDVMPTPNPVKPKDKAKGLTDVLRRSDKSSVSKAANSLSPNLIDEVGEKRKKRQARKNWTELVIEETRHAVKSNRNLLQRVTDTSYYEVFSATLIMANAFFIGWQTQVAGVEIIELRKTQGDKFEHETTETLIISILFTVLFSIELGLRWTADGFFKFFQTQDLAWNLMDITIVCLAFVDCILEAANAQHTLTNNVALLRVLRIIRVVRIARIVRIKRFFKELRIMVYSIMGSCKSLLWVLLVIGLMLYMFGIGFTWAAVNYLRTLDPSEKPEGVQELEKSFGTLDLSLASLFMAMSGGNDWAVYYEALKPLGYAFRWAFLLYISFALFAVVNIVTGVFVDSAMQNNTKDRELIIQEEIQNKKDYLENMAAIFEEIDADNTGYISQDEFEQSLQDERVKAYFHSMKLDVTDARTLFTLLDYDQSTEVNIKEFIAGCYKLQGESRSLDVKIIHYEVRYLCEVLVDIQNYLMPEDRRSTHTGRIKIPASE